MQVSGDLNQETHNQHSRVPSAASWMLEIPRARFELVPKPNQHPLEYRNTERKTSLGPGRDGKGIAIGNGLKTQHVVDRTPKHHFT